MRRLAQLSGPDPDVSRFTVMTFFQNHVDMKSGNTPDDKQQELWEKGPVGLQSSSVHTETNCRLTAETTLSSETSLFAAAFRFPFMWSELSVYTWD